MFESLKKKAGKIKQELNVLRVALSFPEVPWYAKALILLAVSYALSPIDLIPDFIPVLGILDDLIILPLLIFLAIKLVPSEVLEECRKKAAKRPLATKKNWWIGGFIILFWIALVVWLFLKFF